MKLINKYKGKKESKNWTYGYVQSLPLSSVYTSFIHLLENIFRVYKS